MKKYRNNNGRGALCTLIGLALGVLWGYAMWGIQLKAVTEDWKVVEIEDKDGCEIKYRLKEDKWSFNEICVDKAEQYIIKVLNENNR